MSLLLKYPEPPYRTGLEPMTSAIPVVYCDPTPVWPVPSWLVSSVGRALHRYRKGHGFKSRTGLNLFQVLFSTTRFSSVLSCEDHLRYKFLTYTYRLEKSWRAWAWWKGYFLWLVRNIYIARILSLLDLLFVLLLLLLLQFGIVSLN